MKRRKMMKKWRTMKRRRMKIRKKRVKRRKRRMRRREVKRRRMKSQWEEQQEQDSPSCAPLRSSPVRKERGAEQPPQRPRD